MSLDKIKEFFHSLGAHDLLTGGTVLAGLLLLVLVFKGGKMLIRFCLFLIAVGLFAGAYWWHTHR